MNGFYMQKGLLIVPQKETIFRGLFRFDRKLCAVETATSYLQKQQKGCTIRHIPSIKTSVAITVRL